MHPHSPLEEKFWNYVDIKGKNTCWNWKKTKRNGYGRVKDKYRGNLSAHRVSWEIFYGEIPDGALICHKCDNPSCVNPYHLFLGTQADNMNDMWNKNRHPTHNMGRPKETMMGEKNVKSKLLSRDVVKIRELYANGMPQHEIAKLYDVNCPAIWKIVHRRTWAHL